MGPLSRGVPSKSQQGDFPGWGQLCKISTMFEIKLIGAIIVSLVFTGLE